MNRHARRALKKAQHSHVQAFPERLTPLPASEFPQITPRPDYVWRSRKYLVQGYRENNTAFPDLVRLSICYTKMRAGGGWEDGLKWEELQQIKREIGFGDWYGVEIYPPDKDVVNVANFRHLWLISTPLPLGWTK